MKAFSTLPENYEKIYSVDLQSDKKMMLRVNLFAVVIAIVLAVPVHFVVPITALFDMSSGILAYGLRFAMLLILSVAYIILHELVHGVAMKICGTRKVKYGFTGVYAFAGSDDHYDKSGYIFIALAPVVLWGVVLAVVNCFVPESWFWVIYFIQITNLSGAAGDFFVTMKFLGFPKDILIKDSGVSMCVYSAQKEIKQ